MSVRTGRKGLEKTLDIFRESGISMASFATASFWNTEAILAAAARYAREHDMECIPVSISLTMEYSHINQAKRVNYEQNTIRGLISVMEYLHVMCDDRTSPYFIVDVYPHLDHGDPIKDLWALTQGIPYFASVMFDGQQFNYGENVKRLSEYVNAYGREVIIEGIMDELSVDGYEAQNADTEYAEKAADFMKKTKADLLVADLGTEQQSVSVGVRKYLKPRAQQITQSVGRKIMVLHGTSCLENYTLGDMAKDGVIRLNIWTKIAREAGQYAAKRVAERMPELTKGDFEAADSRQYLFDLTDHAANQMYEMLEYMNYEKLMVSKLSEVR